MFERVLNTPLQLFFFFFHALQLKNMRINHENLFKDFQQILYVKYILDPLLSNKNKAIVQCPLIRGIYFLQTVHFLQTHVFYRSCVFFLIRTFLSLLNNQKVILVFHRENC